MPSTASCARIVLAASLLACCALAQRVEAAPIRMAVVSDGFRNPGVVLSTGDVEGTIDTLGEAATNALSPSELRARYDLLVLYGGEVLDLDWATRIEPYLALGGNVIVQGLSPFDQILRPAVRVKSVVNSVGEVIPVGAPVTLASGLPVPFPAGSFYGATFFKRWRSPLAPFLERAGKVVGLYGTFPGGGRIVLNAMWFDYAARPASASLSDRVAYRVLLNEVRWVSGLCDSGPDGDRDGIVDACDACPLAPDPLQEDADVDGVGDACDPCARDATGHDFDGDGFCSDPVLCPAGCDSCPAVANPEQGDRDHDGVGNLCDNCPKDPNPDQADRDHDGVGDLCDDCAACQVAGQCQRGCRNEGTGTCEARPLPDGSACSDSQNCTDDQCIAGACVSVPHVCEQPSNPCYQATCDPGSSGCRTTQRLDGSSCDDGDACTSNDTCTFGACSGDAVAACAADPLKCYSASGGERGTRRITYEDRFASAPLDLVQTSDACAPASEDAAPFDDARHLSCMRVRVPAGVRFARSSVRVSDRFGSTMLRLERPTSYCVPSAVPGDPAVLPLDEFACYRVTGGASGERLLELEDEFGRRTTRVLRPKSLCVPARRDGATLVDAQRTLTCYRARDVGPAASARPLALGSVLASEQLTLRAASQLCVPSTIEPCARITFASSGSSYTGSSFCGGPAFDPAPAPPYVGGVYDAIDGGNLLHQLGGGCIYFGGGANLIYAGTPNPAGATYDLAAGSCEPGALDVVATGEHAGVECARGPADFSICLSDPQHRRCTKDADCPGTVAGRCGSAPRCFAGQPQPFHALVEPTANYCLLTPVDADATGTVDPDTGEMELHVASRTLVYWTVNSFDTCPKCIAGACSSGSRQGRPCRESTSPDQSSFDCPPRPDQLYLTLGPGETLLSTAPTTLSAANGLFCPGQRNPGAFGDPRVRRIELGQGPAGSLRDGQPHVASLLDVKCEPASGSAPADAASDFPGPSARSISGALQLHE